MTKLNLKDISTSTKTKYIVSYTHKGKTYTKTVTSHAEGLKWREALWKKLGLIDVTGYSLERLIRECTVYKDGSLYWSINDTSGTKRMMKKLGTGSTGAGYMQIILGGEFMYLHRAIWLSVHGSLPTKQIDHIDGNKRNNRITNLRDVSCSVNLKNKKKQKNNTSGVTGVSIVEGTDRVSYVATISHNKKVHYLGRFTSLEEAKLVRHRAQEKFSFSATHGL